MTYYRENDTPAGYVRVEDYVALQAELEGLKKKKPLEDLANAISAMMLLVTLVLGASSDPPKPEPAKKTTRAKAKKRAGSARGSKGKGR